MVFGGLRGWWFVGFHTRRGRDWGFGGMDRREGSRARAKCCGKVISTSSRGKRHEFIDDGENVGNSKRQLEVDI